MQPTLLDPLLGLRGYFLLPDLLLVLFDLPGRPFPHVPNRDPCTGTHRSVHCFLRDYFRPGIHVPVSIDAPLRLDVVLSKLLKRGILLAKTGVAVILLLLAFLRGEHQAIAILDVIPMRTYVLV